MLIKRPSRSGANDLNTVFRPYKIEEMCGHETNKNIIRNYLDNANVPHTLLFTGPPGCGKTTAARIIALGLNCKRSESSTSNPCLECVSCRSIIDQNSLDVSEINVGKSGGKDAVESIVGNLSSAPFSSRYKVLIFDEAHMLTDAAKNLLLKILEDGYNHVYFIFCTNQPEKLRGKKGDEDPFLSRCTMLNFHRISYDLIMDMLKNVAEFEGMNYNNEILKFIAEEAKGAPRDALINLKMVADEGSWNIASVKEILGAHLDEDDPQILELSQLLIKGRLQDSFKIYDKLKLSKQEEGIRIAVAGYFVGCLKRSRSFSEATKFSQILDVLNVPIFETGRTGDNKMYNCLFKVVSILRPGGK
jgi:DNA polymerase-3 subunit gamma/tau